jgi:hypothetical protein
MGVSTLANSVALATPQLLLAMKADVYTPVFRRIYTCIQTYIHLYSDVYTPVFRRIYIHRRNANYFSLHGPLMVAQHI